MAETGDQKPPAPFLFRHRGLLIGLAYLLSAGLAYLLQPVWPAGPLDRFLAVAPAGRIGSTGGDVPLVQAAVPFLLVLVCWGWRSWGTSYLRGHVMADSRMHVDRLIVAGPFRWLRNPLYLGNLFMVAAFGLLLPPPGLLLALALHGLLLGTLAHLEAKALRLRHGAEYEAYAARVPSFLPWPPRRGTPDSPVAPDWRNGFLTEAWIPAFALYLLGVQTHQPAITWGAVALMAGVMLRNRAANRSARLAGSPGRRP
ncbi:MAG TPA: hypothetical protein VM286_09355 [Candidatus Thermoplasmatota archaeon]|nr:hypothetical protein [Candidatus Thermoplasmatota archaeon]